MSHSFTYPQFELNCPPNLYAANNMSSSSHSSGSMDSTVESSALDTSLTELKPLEWNDEYALKHLPALSASLSSHFQWMNLLALNQASDSSVAQAAVQQQQPPVQALVNDLTAQHHQQPRSIQHQAIPVASALSVREQYQLVTASVEEGSCSTPVDECRPIIAAACQEQTAASNIAKSLSIHQKQENQCLNDQNDDDEENDSAENHRSKARRLSLKNRHFSHSSSPCVSPPSDVFSTPWVSSSPSSSSSASSSIGAFNDAYAKNRVDAREARKRKRSRVHELENTIENLQKELRELKQMACRQQQQNDRKSTADKEEMMSTSMNYDMAANPSTAFMPQPLHMDHSMPSISFSSSASTPSSPLSSPLQSTSSFSTPSGAASMFEGSISAISVSGACPNVSAACTHSEHRMRALMHAYILAAFEEAKQAEKYDVSAVIKKYHHDPEKAFQALVELQAEMKKRKTQCSNSSSPAAPSKSQVILDEFMCAYRQWLSGCSAHFSSLAHHVHPALPLHFLHWLSNHSDSFYSDRSSLWHALFSDELSFSPQQMKELNSLRQSWKKNSKATVEVEKCFGRLKELMDKQKKLELDEFQHIRSIFTPLQMAKFLNWAGHFAAICIRL